MLLALDEQVLEAARRILGGPCRALETHPFFSPVFDHGRLTIQSAWRASKERRLIGDSGQPKQVLALTEVFVGQSVTWLALKGPYNDLVASFTEGLTIETFADSADWEHWQVVSEHHEMVIAGPGGQWSSFPPSQAARSDEPAEGGA